MCFEARAAKANAILGNQTRELARTATEDGSAATDGPADTFDGPAEGKAPSASLDANASPDATGQMDGVRRDRTGSAANPSRNRGSRSLPQS
jgi:hypothetical protein